ncbi:hypothetical protein APX70_06321 [Pseudomonas syringae pv. maculicola]|uniref:Uncharacterized protein n=3 Tax=Pseudomonas syringae group genomosp. 3 TaxID=251701 RepID=Q887B3_PSESM|nr:protein of unknown function [Pseudomonas syringae pv. tomato str. DC3000]KPB96894.1 Uncharacterized protein AC503_0163 [Pseudomonas syringae pv. maculicola]KPC07321.1 Uncharacterized protein AC506_1919 [Pseudomonas syringae pv. maculicola str. M6]PYD04010.1 hypothetical protein DND90_05765 [Pseudomonas syringae pv. maculicola]RML51553.1 hypothetical protein APX70_06321 [Pseudomonas syringae pv. maculicola]
MQPACKPGGVLRHQAFITGQSADSIAGMAPAANESVSLGGLCGGLDGGTLVSCTLGTTSVC